MSWVLDRTVTVCSTQQYRARATVNDRSPAVEHCDWRTRSWWVSDDRRRHHRIILTHYQPLYQSQHHPQYHHPPAIFVFSSFECFLWVSALGRTWSWAGVSTKPKILIFAIKFENFTYVTWQQALRPIESLEHEANNIKESLGAGITCCNAQFPCDIAALVIHWLRVLD